MPLRVLISGAGVAGPAAAWWLAQIGARVTVVEKASEALPHGQNIDVNGCALTVIRKMGLLDELRRLNTKEVGTKFIAPNMKEYALFPMVKGSTLSPTSEFEILRGDLARMLYGASKDLPGVSYLFNTTVTDVISNEDDSVKVQLSNGQTQEYDLLIAADGQWSRIRQQCFPTESVTLLDKGSYTAYMTIPRLPEDDDWWSLYNALPSKLLSLRPDPHGTCRAFFSIMPVNDAQKKEWEEASRSDRQTKEQLLEKEFANVGWQARRILDAMSNAPDFYFHPIVQVRMSHWSTERVLLLGDTAFCPTPLTGAGASLALLGAYNLAGELSKLEPGEHPRKALEAYEKGFRPFVEQVQEVPSFFPAVIHPATPIKLWALSMLLSTISKVISIIRAVPFLRSKFDQANEENTDGYILPEYPTMQAKPRQEKSIYQ